MNSAVGMLQHFFQERRVRTVGPSFWQKRNRSVLLVAAALAVLTGAGCGGGNGARKKPPDQRYGHRYETPDAKGRRTLSVTAPEAGPSYAFYDVPVSEVIVRAPAFEEGEDAVPVELLIEGALPNDCLALHRVQQERDGHFLYVTLTMRWPKQADCKRFERPFRFYLPLEGRYPPGDYTLKLDGTAYPFTLYRGG